MTRRGSTKSAADRTGYGMTNGPSATATPGRGFSTDGPAPEPVVEEPIPLAPNAGRGYTGDPPEGTLATEVAAPVVDETRQDEDLGGEQGQS